MNKLIKVLRHKPAKILVFLWKRLGRWCPDEPYLKVLYRLMMGKRLNLKNPKTFSEKLQWLKLHDHKQEYTTMVDKYAVKDYVASIIGKEYIIPTLGVWDKVEDIDWDILPNQFVLKCTHDSGGLVICKDKTKLNKETAIKKLNFGLKQDYFKVYREWPYKSVPKRIIAEKYIEPSPDVKDLPDYKWYCFSGEPKYCQVIQNRFSNETIDFFNTEWVHQDFVGLNPIFVSADTEPKRPEHLETQLQIARRLSKDIPFSRIDLYEIGEQTYFGEITFYPMSGFGEFKPNHYNELLGRMISLPGESYEE